VCKRARSAKGTSGAEMQTAPAFDASGLFR
jgi:hypothetical protein